MGSGSRIEPGAGAVDFRADEEMVRARGRLAFEAAGDIQVHDIAALPAGASEVVGGEVYFLAGGVIRIDNGAVLASDTGKVSNAPPRLRIGELDPDDVIVPGDRTQDLSGTVGGIEGEGDNLEQGANFTLTVVWDDGTVSVLPGVNAGDTVVWFIGEDGTSDPVIVPCDGTGPIDVLIVREYPISYLITVTETELVADVEVDNDANIRLYDSTGVDLNRVDATVETSFAGEQFHQAPIILVRPRPEILPSEAPRPVPVETRPVPAEKATRYEEIRGGQEAVAEEQRQVYIVKVGADGTESNKELLPQDALSNLKALFDRFRQKGLPNGVYRIYLKEPGFPRRQVIEFYKSGDSFSVRVREPGRGSKPRTDTEGPNVPEERLDQVPRGRQGQVNQAMPELLAAAAQGRRWMAETEVRPMTRVAQGLKSWECHEAPTPSATGDPAAWWASEVDRAMSASHEGSFTNRARLQRWARR